MNSISKQPLFMAILYLLVFFLLAEWLSPVIELTSTGHRTVFLVFIGAGLLLSYLKCPWWISGPLKILYILWAVGYIFLENSFFGEGLWTTLTEDFGKNFSALADQNWNGTTDIFRTILFFVLLWMAVYLLHYWVGFRSSIFLFYALTVIYIAVLDTFTTYPGNAAIIRVMVIGLVLAGLLHLARWSRRHEFSVNSEKALFFIGPLVVMVGIAAITAMYLPKAGPIWPDPVPYIVSYSGQGGSGTAGNGVGRIGYGVDDSQLGGSFVGDDSPVFTAEVTDGQYWKVESRDTYTGKGWEMSGEAEEVTVYTDGETLATDFEVGPEEDADRAAVSMQQSFPFALYPYGLESLSMDEGANYEYNTADQRIETFRNGEMLEPTSYAAAYSEPAFSLSALRATTREDLAGLTLEFDRYKQLPSDLPERVRELANEITADAGSVYDMTTAVERYFGSNGFEYSQTDIPVPEGNQDYVDQFLFETKRGYCDNFSTSMVVMLRSLDIPARWVKGFNEGEEIGGGSDFYQITNNNAHSWVEAYMPGVGWMVFEPTIGFDGGSDIDFDLDVDTTDPEEPEVPERPEVEPPLPEEGDTGAVSEDDSFGEALAAFVDKHKGKLLLIPVVLLVIAILLFWQRRKWLPKVLIPYYRRKKGEKDSFEKAYMRLLKQLDLYGIRRKQDETLRSYASYVDSSFGTQDMSRLTKAYEALVYGGKVSSEEWEELKESWENLINRTSG